MWELCKNREARFLFFSFLTLPSGSAWHQLFFLFPETPRERIFPRGRGQIEGEVRNKASSSQNSFVRRSSVPITLFVCPECRLDSSVWIKQLVFWCRAWRSLHRSVFDLSCLFISWLLSDPRRRSSLDCRAVRVDTGSIPGRCWGAFRTQRHICVSKLFRPTEGFNIWLLREFASSQHDWRRCDRPTGRPVKPASLTQQSV